MPGDTKRKILIAAMDCIEQGGFGALRVRDIAEKAGVNLAAINYHFGNKSLLMQDVFAYSIRHLKLWVKQCEAPGQREGLLKEILLQYFEGLFTYPELSKAHFHAPFNHRRYEGPVLQAQQELFETFYKKALTDLQVPESAENRMALVQVFSSLLFPAFFPDLFKMDSGSDFHGAPFRRQYLDQVLDSFLARLKPV